MKNPTTLLNTRSGQQATIYSLTEEQILTLLAQPNKNTFTGFRDHTMLMLMLDTGIRLGEIIQLKVSQLDLKQCFLLSVIGKSRRPRDVPFSGEARKGLMKYLQNRGSGVFRLCLCYD